MQMEGEPRFTHQNFSRRLNAARFRVSHGRWSTVETRFRFGEDSGAVTGRVFNREGPLRAALADSLAPTGGGGGQASSLLLVQK